MVPPPHPRQLTAGGAWRAGPEATQTSPAGAIAGVLRQHGVSAGWLSEVRHGCRVAQWIKVLCSLGVLRSLERRVCLKILLGFGNFTSKVSLSLASFCFILDGRETPPCPTQSWVVVGTWGLGTHEVGVAWGLGDVSVPRLGLYLENSLWPESLTSVHFRMLKSREWGLGEGRVPVFTSVRGTDDVHLPRG